VNAQPVTVRRIGLGLIIAAAVLTSGCAAGQQAGTANQQATQDGVDRTLGPIRLAALAVRAPSGATYPAGSAAQVRLVIVNTGQHTDTLTSITSPEAGGWAAYRTAADAAQALAATSSAATSSAPTSSSPASSSSPSGSSGSSGSSGAGSSSATSSSPPSPTSTAAPVPRPQTSVAIPAGMRVSWGVPDSKGTLLLLGVKRALYPGTVIELTFTFQRAGTITIAVPIQVSSAPGSSTVPGPSATGQDR
jgi:copper(I)-binding protein